MQIAIISDTHNNEVNLKKVLDYCQTNAIGTIICCGDLASETTLDFINDNFSGTIHYTFGNMDNDQLKEFIRHPMSSDHNARKTSDVLNVPKYKNTFLYQNFGELKIENEKIAFVHFPEAAKELCQSGKYDFVFYGHTHKPWSAEVLMKETVDQKSCTMLNPGNVAGEIYPPTFAVWNTDNNKFDLIRIHDLK